MWWNHQIWSIWSGQGAEIRFRPAVGLSDLVFVSALFWLRNNQKGNEIKGFWCFSGAQAGPPGRRPDPWAWLRSGVSPAGPESGLIFLNRPGCFFQVNLKKIIRDLKKHSWRCHGISQLHQYSLAGGRKCHFVDFPEFQLIRALGGGMFF